MEVKMRKIFIDMGTHYGEGLREFIQKFSMDSSWIIHTFEANPKSYNIFVNNYAHLTPFVFHHNKAVSVNNEVVTINAETYREEIGTGQGSSIIPLNSWNTNQVFQESFNIPSIDISEFIGKHFTRSDQVVVKMDIEGSEYDVLEKMIADDTISIISEIYIEWHSRCFVDNTHILQRESKLKEILPTKVSKVYTWI
jgi:FkbM family methyltransferase